MISHRHFAALLANHAARCLKHLRVVALCPLALVITMPPASAATDPQAAAALAEAAGECMRIKRNKDRLTCFDRAAQAAGLSANAMDDPPLTDGADAGTTTAGNDSAAATAGAVATAAASGGEAASITDPEDFGREQVERRQPDKDKKDKEREQIEVVITQIDKRGDDLLVFTLDNGQVWRQKSLTALFRVREGDSVVIRKGSFGGYTLVAPGRRSTQVTRLK